MVRRWRGNDSVGMIDWDFRSSLRGCAEMYVCEDFVDFEGEAVKYLPLSAKREKAGIKKNSGLDF